MIAFVYIREAGLPTDEDWDEEERCIILKVYKTLFQYLLSFVVLMNSLSTAGMVSSNVSPERITHI